MLILAIDTSTRTGSVALLRDNLVVDQVSGYEETPHSTRLFRDLELLQSRAHFSLGDVDIFAVAAGPGSFTGLRVGLTAVKAWSEVYGKPIAPVSGLEAIAAQSLSLKGSAPVTGTIAPFLDARRGQLFGSLYRPTGTNGSLQLISEESILTVEEFVEIVKGNRDGRNTILVSPTPEILPAENWKVSLPETEIETVSAVLAPTIGHLGFDLALRGDLVDALSLDANYVRRSDAESRWKDE